MRKLMMTKMMMMMMMMMNQQRSGLRGTGATHNAMTFLTALKHSNEQEGEMGGCSPQTSRSDGTKLLN